MEKRNLEIIKVAIVGTESTGKSTLAKALATAYNSVWVAEFARDYLTKKNGKYNFDDLEYIAKQQLLLEKKQIKKANQFLFCDTNLTVIKIWSEFVFGKVCNFIIEEIEKQKYNTTFVTDIDIPWEPDPLREHPNKRNELFSIYKNELEKQKITYYIISGTHLNRLESAKNIINSIYKIK